MPSSQVAQIGTVMELVLATRPMSVLDIGVGFGKYGFLCREYLELWDGREVYSDWQRNIDGIEAFPKYITPMHDYIYNNIYIGDAQEVVPQLIEKGKEYDLILMIDVIEHFSIDDGMNLLRSCSKISKACLVSTPLNASPQGAAFENDYETHRSQWRQEHFGEFPNKVIIPNARALLAYLRFDGVQVQMSSGTQQTV